MFLLEISSYKLRGIKAILGSAQSISDSANSIFRFIIMAAFPIHDQFHIRLFLCGFLQVNAGGWSTHGVKDSIWRFYMNDRDGASIDFNHSNFALRAKCLYLIPAEVFFHCRSEQPFDHFYVHFDVMGISRGVKNQLFSFPVELTPNAALEKETRAVAKIARIAGASTPDFASQYRVQALMTRVLSHYLQNLSTHQMDNLERSSALQAPVSRALEFIENNFATELNNAVLANLCGLSQDHFARRFREITGETPGQFIRRRRIAIASQELLFSQAGIDEIAARTGFCNRFYFSRVFNSEMGMPPAAFRKMTRP